jgi:hypothetical protein
MHNYSRPLPRARSDEPWVLTTSTGKDDVGIVKSMLGAFVLRQYLYVQKTGDMEPSTAL